MQILPNPKYFPSYSANSLTLRLVVLLWLLPVLLTLAKAPASVILAATTAAFAFCVGAQLLNSYLLPYILPFIALLSPITGFLKLGGANLLYSDLFFPLLALQASLIAIARPPQRSSKLLFLLGLMSTVSTIAGVAIGLDWLKPVLYLLQMVLVAFFTLRAVKNADDLSLLRNVWIMAAVMGSVIMLQAYLEGRSLILVTDIVQEREVDIAFIANLFRSSYYYTNFHFVLGLCIVWTSLHAFLSSSKNQRFLALAAFSILMLALISSANKTALFSSISALLVTVVVLLHRHPRKMSTSISGAILPIIFVLCLAIWSFAQSVVSQLEFIGVGLVSVSSFFIRLEVFQQALSAWFSSPLNMLLGYGLGMLEGSDSKLSVLFKTSSITGYSEGTLDSAWLSYLVELGLPGLLLLAALFARGIHNSLRGLRNCPSLDEFAFAEATLFASLVYLVFAMSTQMIGYSKISWLPLQLLVVAAVGLRRTPA